MKSGQIVRRKVQSGTPIGPWLQIIGFSGNFVSVRVIETGETTLILRENVHQPKVAVLPVSAGILKRILSGHQIAVEHDSIGLWKRAALDGSELVKLYDCYGNCAYYVINNITSSTTRIRIVLDYKIIQL